MIGDVLQLYPQGGEADAAFLLEDGEAFYYASNSDKYSLKGRNFILGASEVIITHMLGVRCPRLETVVISSESRVKRISLEKFLSGMAGASFALNAAMVTARQVVLTNAIIRENVKQTGGGRKTHREVCLEYYAIVHIICEEYEKRRLPWLKEILSEYQPSLTYKQGEIFARATEPVRMRESSELADHTVEMPRDTVIFEEGSEGREMYILRSGAVDILVGGNRVATLTEPGTSIGEIALLLGEKRSATMRAANNVVLTRIGQADIRELSEAGSPIFQDIAKSLARKHEGNSNTIRSVNEAIIQQNVGLVTDEQKKQAQINQKAVTELETLRKTVGDALFARQKDADFLRERLRGRID